MNVTDIAITGVCIALTLVATEFINIRLPIAANGGLVHLGNVPLFLAAIIYGKKTGAFAGAFGMGLFDLLSGWTLWAPLTLCCRYCSGDTLLYSNRLNFLARPGSHEVNSDLPDMQPLSSFYCYCSALK